jgi:hypothetical protein
MFQKFGMLRKPYLASPHRRIKSTFWYLMRIKREESFTSG